MYEFQKKLYVKIVTAQVNVTFYMQPKYNLIICNCYKTYKCFFIDKVMQCLLTIVTFCETPNTELDLAESIFWLQYYPIFNLLSRV